MLFPKACRVYPRQTNIEEPPTRCNINKLKCSYVVTSLSFGNMTIISRRHLVSFIFRCGLPNPIPIPTTDLKSIHTRNCGVGAGCLLPYPFAIIFPFFILLNECMSRVVCVHLPVNWFGEKSIIKPSYS